VGVEGQVQNLKPEVQPKAMDTGHMILGKAASAPLNINGTFSG